MKPLVSLPMYAAPRDALDAFWSILRARLLAAGFDEAPEALDQPDDLHAHWRSPDLLLSQTCGRPLATFLDGVVVPLATPRYDVFGCDGPTYSSLFVVRDDDPAKSFADLRGRRAVYNDRHSHSGFSQLFAEAAAHGAPFFGDAFASGAHVRSMVAVADGSADVAAIDCVTFALAATAAVAGLRVLAQSPPAPALPFVTSAARPAHEIAALRAALVETVRDPAARDACRAMALGDVSFVPTSTYSVCRDRALIADRAFAAHALA